MYVLAKCVAAALDVLRSRERIGSSQRYGYLFGDEKIWTAEPHVQMYLDSISKKLPMFELVATTTKKAMTIK